MELNDHFGTLSVYYYDDQRFHILKTTRMFIEKILEISRIIY